jgi:hypothetical protein
MTSVAMLSPIMLCVVILNVVAPQRLKSEINLSARERERVRESERVYEQRNDKNEKKTNTFFLFHTQEEQDRPHKKVKSRTGRDF